MYLRTLQLLRPSKSHMAERVHEGLKPPAGMPSLARVLARARAYFINRAYPLN